MTNTPAAARVAQSLVAEIVSSYVQKNKLAPTDLPGLIDTVHQSLLSAGTAVEPGPPRTPAVPIRRSVMPDYVVCLECGRRRKTLRRHLQSSHGLTPHEYRAKWGLRPEHPITAPAYSNKRSTTAKQMGFGRRAKGRPRRRQGPKQPA